jgi:hypothetical protein
MALKDFSKSAVKLLRLLGLQEVHGWTWSLVIANFSTEVPSPHKSVPFILGQDQWTGALTEFCVFMSPPLV